MKKFSISYKYTNKWQLYADYLIMICALILIYRRLFYESNMIGAIIWIFIAILPLYRLKYNNGKFNDKK